MAFESSLQEKFHRLLSSLNSFGKDLTVHRDMTQLSGVSATQQREMSNKVNVMLPLVSDSLTLPNLASYWIDHRPTVSYEPMSDLTALVVELKDFQWLVFSGTPKNDPPNEYIKDTLIFLDGQQEHEITPPHDGDHIITYGPRVYTAGQASAYVDQLNVLIARIETIVNTTS